MHSKLARRVLGTLVSAAVMVSMIPAMVFAADATAVNVTPTSGIDAPGRETIEGIDVEVAGEDSNIGYNWGIGVGTTEAGGTFTFSINESGAYAGYVITKINIDVTNVSSCAMTEGNEGWGTLASNTDLIWEGAATTVPLNLVATSGRNHTVGYSAITVYVSVPPTGVTVVDADGATSGYAYVDDVFELTASVAPETTALTAVTWSTDDTTGSVEIADGVVSASAAGTYNIIATVTNYSSVSDSYELSVYEHVNGASISDTKVDDLLVGYTYGLEAYPTNLEHVRDADWDVTFVSSNEEIATVTTTEVQELGQVTALAEGEVTITAIITDYSQPLLTAGEGSEQAYQTYEVDCVFNISAVDTVTMYRLYNPNSGEHFYTADIAERDNLESLGWSYEGIGWIAPAISNTPVYRLYNPNAGEHHYTTDAAERDMLVEAGWNYEDIGWYSDDFETVPVYRQYNPNEFANNHNYTADENEKNHLIDLGWQDEGTGWFAISRALQEA